MLEKSLVKNQEELASASEQLDNLNYSRNQQDRELTVLQQQIDGISAERDHYHTELKVN
jgi:uncharacterized protein HemX